MTTTTTTVTVTIPGSIASPWVLQSVPEPGSPFPPSTKCCGCNRNQDQFWETCFQNLPRQRASSPFLLPGCRRPSHFDKSKKYYEDCDNKLLGCSLKSPRSVFWPQSAESIWEHSKLPWSARQWSSTRGPSATRGRSHSRTRGTSRSFQRCSLKPFPGQVST